MASLLCHLLPERSGVGLNELLGGRLEFPAGKHKDGRMAVESSAQHLGSLYAQVDATILDAGDGRLRDAAQGGELGLAKALQLTNSPHRLTRSDIDAPLGGNELAHIRMCWSGVGLRAPDGKPG